MSKKSDIQAVIGIFGLFIYLLGPFFRSVKKDEGLVSDNEESVQHTMTWEEAKELGYKTAWVEGNVYREVVFLIFGLGFLPYLAPYYLYWGIVFLFRKTGRVFRYEKENTYTTDRRYSSGQRVDGYIKRKHILSSSLSKKGVILQKVKGLALLLFLVPMYFQFQTIVNIAQAENTNSEAGDLIYLKTNTTLYSKPNNKSHQLSLMDDSCAYQIIDSTIYFYKVLLHQKEDSIAFVLKADLNKNLH